MIGDIYVFRARNTVTYCRVLSETPRTVTAVIVRGSALPGSAAGYGNGYPARTPRA